MGICRVCKSAGLRTILLTRCSQGYKSEVRSCAKSADRVLCKLFAPDTRDKSIFSSLTAPVVNRQNIAETLDSFRQARYRDAV